MRIEKTLLIANNGKFKKNCIGFFFLQILTISIKERICDDNMTYIGEQVKEKFNSLSDDLKNVILERNVRIENIHDLIYVLEQIVKEGEK